MVSQRIATRKKNHLSSFRHYRNLILHKAYADFRAEAERTYLGVAWWVLEPLINMTIYYLVFGMFLRQSTDDFVPFLLTGLVVWRFFDATVMRASSSILSNMGLVRQVAFKKIIFPIIAVVVCCYEFVFSLALLLVVFLIYGIMPNAYWLLAPVLLLLLLIFTLGFAIPLAAISPFVPDLLKLVQYSLRMVFYLSAIVYRFEQLPENVQAFLHYNPAVHLVEAFRDVLMYSRMPDWSVLGRITIVSLLLLAGGLYLHERFNLLYAKRVTS